MVGSKVQRQWTVRGQIYQVAARFGEYEQSDDIRAVSPYAGERPGFESNSDTDASCVMAGKPPEPQSPSQRPGSVADQFAEPSPTGSILRTAPAS